VRAEQFVPFSILFASGQRLEIKTREHIGLGPVSRTTVEELKAVIVWDDTGKWRSLYLRAILKIERSHLKGARASAPTEKALLATGSFVVNNLWISSELIISGLLPGRC
jgi:hypothetical protein